MSTTDTGQTDYTQKGCALVTGASSGIGAACAHALAAGGWTVGVNFKANAAGADRIVEAITAAGGRAVALQGDVAEQADVERIFERLEADHGPVLVLVNNAGITRDGLAVQIDDDEWTRVLETNLSGAFRVTRRALRQMIRMRFGRIVNITSLSGLRGVPGQANYASAKAGLIGLTMSVGVEVARRGVTVNAVAPGVIETDMVREMVIDGVAGKIPAKRVGQVEEVAACVRFLASRDAGYVTGIVLPVDGGMSASAM
jgi:3-oxoacyl-[acyl-carrier protein] reductase